MLVSNVFVSHGDSFRRFVVTGRFGSHWRQLDRRRFALVPAGQVQLETVCLVCIYDAFAAEDDYLFNCPHVRLGHVIPFSPIWINVNSLQTTF